MAKNHSTPIQLFLPVDDATMEIPLYGGRVSIIDALDGDLALKHWTLSTKRNRAYVTRIEYPDRKTILLHRVIAGRLLGRELVKGEMVDHVDNDPLNNRRVNLRVCSNTENVRNCSISKNNTSGYKGVYKNAQGHWFAQIMVNRKSIWLGIHGTPEEAHDAYCVAAVKYFGEFARFK